MFTQGFDQHQPCGMAVSNMLFQRCLLFEPACQRGDIWSEQGRITGALGCLQQVTPQAGGAVQVWQQQVAVAQVRGRVPLNDMVGSGFKQVLPIGQDKYG